MGDNITQKAEDAFKEFKQMSQNKSSSVATSDNNQEIITALNKFESDKAISDSTNGASQTNYINSNETSKMIGLVYKLSGGKIKEQKKAEIVLLLFVFFATAITLYLFFGFSYSSSDSNETIRNAEKFLPPPPNSDR